MKIKVVENITEIEADARELRESNTLAEKFTEMLARCFGGSEPLDDDEDDGDEEDSDAED